MPNKEGNSVGHAYDEVWADAVIGRALGSYDSFVADNWRRSGRLARSAAAGRLPEYDVDDYLRDLIATHGAPYFSVSVHDGARYFGKHESEETLRAAIDEGGVSAMKISRYWHGDCPEAWTWMRTLFGALCRRIAMVYLSPQRSEDVDLFLAGPSSGLGRHFDSTDVFTFQLYGERKWTFDALPDVERVLAVTAERDWYPAKEIDFQGDTVEVTVRPGDALYVPAYCVHEVSGVTWSVALSLGLRAYNEIDIIEHLLERIRRTKFHHYGPLPAFPESAGDSSYNAKLETLAKVRAVMTTIEAATLAMLVNPPALPGDFGLSPGEAEPGMSGVFRSGFALTTNPAADAR